MSSSPEPFTYHNSTWNILSSFHTFKHAVFFSVSHRSKSSPSAITPPSSPSGNLVYQIQIGTSRAILARFLPSVSCAGNPSTYTQVEVIHVNKNPSVTPDVIFARNAFLLGFAILGIAFGIQLARRLQGGLDHFYEFLSMEREVIDEGDKHALRKKLWPVEKYEKWARRRSMRAEAFYVSANDGLVFVYLLSSLTT
jgi:hypothetical protein